MEGTLAPRQEPIKIGDWTFPVVIRPWLATLKRLSKDAEDLRRLSKIVGASRDNDHGNGTQLWMITHSLKDGVPTPQRVIQSKRSALGSGLHATRRLARRARR